MLFGCSWCFLLLLLFVLLGCGTQPVFPIRACFIPFLSGAFYLNFHLVLLLSGAFFFFFLGAFRVWHTSRLSNQSLLPPFYPRPDSLADSLLQNRIQDKETIPQSFSIHSFWGESSYLLLTSVKHIVPNARLLSCLFVFWIFFDKFPVAPPQPAETQKVFLIFAPIFFSLKILTLAL